MVPTSRDTAVSVLDSSGAGIAGAVVNFYGSTGSWVGNRTTDACGVLRYELLVGSYRFQATHNGGSQQLNLSVVPELHELVELPRVGHMAPVENPVATTAAIRGLVASAA